MKYVIGLCIFVVTYSSGAAGFTVAYGIDQNNYTGSEFGFIHDTEITRHSFVQFQGLYKQYVSPRLANQIYQELDIYSIELSYLWKLPLSRNFQPSLGVGMHVEQERGKNRLLVHPNGSQFINRLNNSKNERVYIALQANFQGKDFGMTGLLLFSKILVSNNKQQLVIGIGYQDSN